MQDRLRILLSPCGRGRGPSRSDGKVRGIEPLRHTPHPPATRVPPSPARGEGSNWRMRCWPKKGRRGINHAPPPPGTSKKENSTGESLFLGGGLAGRRHHGVGDEPGIRADRPLDGVADRRGVLEEALGILAALADALAVIGEP